ncbi:hypothetical protein ELI37_19820 [Rhizobium leguminosarum]|uniref:integrase arm-type DNA-binding domain-containing protein n=1 Tax=Rhizobium leguminosarum TaxID=384 RepID=UPI001030091E|nr:integrase arm-type DNA-binding domain-containing protein [Rhizobium leguminosarum]TAV12587.1 hypothetical protein ELI37_19820 [Rhizobium leguminosarum]
MVIREALNNTHIADALKLAASGTTELQEWADLREPGLRLRVRRYNATWVLKFRDNTVTLGPADRWNVANVRAAASHVRGMVRSGLNPKPWIDARLAGASADEAAAVVLRREGKDRKEWTVSTLMERYLEDYIKVGRIIRGKRNPPSANTARDVEAMCRQKPYTDISALILRELNEHVLESYRDNLTKLHGGSASRKGLGYLKAALSWARKHHSSLAGLVNMPRWWRDVSALHVEKSRTRMPTVDDLAMTIAIADAARRLPGRSIDAEINESTIGALWLLAFTAHRREAVVTIQRGELIEDERAGDGSGLLYRPPTVMKGKREHVLPLPPSAMEVLRPFMQRSATSKWLLPAARLGKNGSSVHVHGSSINKLLLRLRGKDEKGRAVGAPDLLSLAGVTVFDWSPHDLRRTLSTMVEDWTTRGDAASAVLDHQGHGEAGRSFDAAAITRTAYSQSQRLPLKKIAMSRWCDEVCAAVELARPKAAEIVASSIGPNPNESQTLIATG